MQWPWQTQILKGGSRENFLHTIYVFHKLWVQEVEIESPCLIGMYGCCGLLVLLNSSGASVNDEAGIGSYYIVEGDGWFGNNC